MKQAGQRWSMLRGKRMVRFAPSTRRQARAASTGPSVPRSSRLPWPRTPPFRTARAARSAPTSQPASELAIAPPQSEPALVGARQGNRIIALGAKSLLFFRMQTASGTVRVAVEASSVTSVGFDDALPAMDVGSPVGRCTATSRCPLTMSMAARGKASPAKHKVIAPVPISAAPSVTRVRTAASTPIATLSPRSSPAQTRVSRRESAGLNAAHRRAPDQTGRVEDLAGEGGRSSRHSNRLLGEGSAITGRRRWKAW